MKKKGRGRGRGGKGRGSGKHNKSSSVSSKVKGTNNTNNVMKKIEAMPNLMHQLGARRGLQPHQYQIEISDGDLIKTLLLQLVESDSSPSDVIKTIETQQLQNKQNLNEEEKKEEKEEKEKEDTQTQIESQQKSDLNTHNESSNNSTTATTTSTSGSTQSCAWKECDKLNSKSAFSACSRCRVAYYCCKEHQICDWKSGHKKICTQLTNTQKDISLKGQIVHQLANALNLEISLLAYLWNSDRGKGCLSIYAKDFIQWTTEKGIDDCQLFISYFTTQQIKVSKSSHIMQSHNLNYFIESAPADCIVIVVHDETGYSSSLQLPLTTTIQNHHSLLNTTINQGDHDDSSPSHLIIQSDLVAIDTMSTEIGLLKLIPKT